MDKKRRAKRRPVIVDVLADRYASFGSLAIWEPKAKIRMERQFWISALWAQRVLGQKIAEEEIRDYERVLPRINLASIAAREAITHQDVKARIEEFNALAGHELIHRGFTSRDLTDNIEQVQVYRSLQLVRDRAVAVLRRFSCRAAEYCLLDMCGRSHLIPGQVTTLGKRFANCAQELLIAFEQLEYLIATYPGRGIKGAMGTQQDMLDVLGGFNQVMEFERRVMESLRIPRLLASVGQVYPRSLDFQVVSTLTQLASGMANFAMLVRLLAGFELAHEGFEEGQTGSTAMLHKINSKTSERIDGLLIILGGYLSMTKGLLGRQLLEGDVSCSAPRRVALPCSFFAIDGMLESVMTVLDKMQIFPGMIEKELRHYLPFLSTTKILMEMLRRGVGRETAHKLIKKHAVAALEGIRRGEPNSFAAALSGDVDCQIPPGMMANLMLNPSHGLADYHVRVICEKIDRVVGMYPKAATYNPELVL